MRNAKRKQAFRSRPRVHPLVGIGSSLRHSRFNLYKLAAQSRPPLAHYPVTQVLRNWRVPRSQKIRSKGEHVVRVGQIKGRQLVKAKAQFIGTAQDRLLEELELDCRRGANRL